MSLSRIILNFNSHAHVERDPSEYQIFSGTENFNSHAHVERDLITYRVNHKTL